MVIVTVQPLRKGQAVVLPGNQGQAHHSAPVLGKTTCCQVVLLLIHWSYYLAIPNKLMSRRPLGPELVVVELISR